MKSDKNPNFESDAHSMVAGVFAGLLMEMLDAKPVIEKDGQYGPRVRISLPEGFPFPVHSAVVYIEPPEEDVTMADFLSTIMAIPNEPLRDAAMQAARKSGLTKILAMEENPDA